jgi:hypothetical protein
MVGSFRLTFQRGRITSSGTPTEEPRKKTGSLPTVGSISFDFLEIRP